MKIALLLAFVCISFAVLEAEEEHDGGDGCNEGSTPPENSTIDSYEDYDENFTINYDQYTPYIVWLNETNE